MFVVDDEKTENHPYTDADAILLPMTNLCLDLACSAIAYASN